MRMNIRWWRVSSPISCSRNVIRGSVRSLGPGDLQGEPGLEHGLEDHAGGGDRPDLLAGEPGLLVGGEVEVEPGHAQQLVGEDLAGADVAGEVGVGFDDPLGRCGGQAVDLGADGIVGSDLLDDDSWGLLAMASGGHVRR